MLPLAVKQQMIQDRVARLEDRKRALMAGYQSHLAKPVDPTELVAMVASMTQTSTFLQQQLANLPGSSKSK